MEPHLREGAGGFRPQRLHTEDAFPAFDRDFDLPPTAAQPHGRLGGEHRRRQGREDQHPSREPQALRFGGPFFMALPACVPGTTRWLGAETIRMHPALHRRLPARGLDEHWQGADGFQGLPLQGLPQDHRLSVRITQNYTKYDIPLGGPDFGEFLSVKPHISLSQELKQVQVLLREVEDDIGLSRETQDMNPNKVVEHPPCGGVLDTFAFLIRKGGLVVRERVANAVLSGCIDEHTDGHPH
jgi:hypothetical protein